MNKLVLVLITVYSTMVAVGYGMSCRAAEEEDINTPVRGFLKTIVHHFLLIPAIYACFVFISAGEDMSMLISKMKKKDTNGG